MSAFLIDALFLAVACANFCGLSAGAWTKMSNGQFAGVEISGATGWLCAFALYAIAVALQ